MICIMIYIVVQTLIKAICTDKHFIRLAPCTVKVCIAYVLPVLIIFEVFDLLLGSTSRSFLQLNAEVLSLLRCHHYTCNQSTHVLVISTGA